MQVVDHEPSGWFLVQDDDQILLDVNCSHSFISYDFLMKLNEHEVAAFSSNGHDFILELA
jgi:hypothetical protein